MLTYFLQVNLCWLLFYGLYYMLLSKETFFTLNRIYLIISLLAGLMLPFCIQTVEMPLVLPLIETMQPIVQTTISFEKNIETNIMEKEASWSIWVLLKGVYILGFVFCLFKLLMGLRQIFKLYKNGFVEKNAQFSLVNIEGVASPFSFFKWVFIDKNNVQNADFQSIITHELAHVRQGHSYDVLSLQILRGVFWMSPLLYLYNRSLRHVHEYAADAAVLENIGKKQYGTLLIRQSVGANGLALVNYFNFSQLKKRLMMMTRSRSQRISLAKYAFAMPIFAFLNILFTRPDNLLIKNTEGVSQKMESVINTVDNNLKNALQKIDNQANNDNSLITLAGKSCCFLKPEIFRRQTSLVIKDGHSITSFKLERYKNRFKDDEIHEFAMNTGGIFNLKTRELLEKAELGDNFYFKNIRVYNHETKDEYIYGEMSFTISMNTEFFAELLTLKDANNQSIYGQNFDVSELSQIKSIFLRPEEGIVYENDIEITRFPKNIGEKMPSITNKGLVFSKESLDFIKQGKIGEGYHFRVKYHESQGGEPHRGSAWKTIKILDKSIEVPPCLMLPNSKDPSKITLEEFKNIDYLIAKSIEKGIEKTHKIVKFNVVVNPQSSAKRKPQSIENQGANFKDALKRLINSVEEGDDILINSSVVFDREKNSNVATGGLAIFNIKSNNTVKEQEEPIAMLNTGFLGGSITYDQLNSSTHVIFKIKGTEKLFNCKNVEIAVRRDPVDGSKWEIVRNKGIEFNDSVRWLLKKAQLNDSYSIYYRNVEGAENSKKYLMPINVFQIYAAPKKNVEGKPHYPNPILGNFKMGDIPISEFLKMKELSLEKGGNSIEGEITSFILMRIPEEKDIIQQVINRGAKFSEYTLGAIQKAKIGDEFIFDSVVFQIKGSSEKVTLPGLAYKIK